MLVINYLVSNCYIRTCRIKQIGTILYIRCLLLQEDGLSLPKISSTDYLQLTLDQMFSFSKKNPIKIIIAALSLCLAASCSTSPSTPYYDSTSYDSARNPYMAQPSPYGQAASPAQNPPAYGGGYGGGQNPYAGQNQYGSGYQQPPAYGGNYYQQPTNSQAPASRYYSNPYAMPSQQNPYYDQDQYYKPPSHYNSVSDDAADTSFR